MARERLEWSPAPRFRKLQVVEKPSVATEGRPSCPKFHTPEERAMFRKMVRALEARRTCTREDGPLLSLFVTTWSLWRRAQDDLIKRGDVVKVIARGKNDEVIEREKPNPFLAISVAAHKDLVALLDRLGMTPLNRESVKPVKPESEKNVPVEPGSARWWAEKADEIDGGTKDAN